MASWTNIGANDVSEETRVLRDKLASKDGHIAAQQDQLTKQTEELEELRRTLKETQYKLGSESDRVLRLEADLKTRSQELQNVKLTAQNSAQALAAAQESIKEKSLEARDLEAHLERLSRTNGNQNSLAEKIQQEKRLLEAHVRELQDELARATSQPKIPIRPRSSSTSDVRNNVMQQEVAQIRASLNAKDVELSAANEKASRAQAELIRVENEKTALERKSAKEIASLTSLLEEKDSEMEYLRSQGMDDSREQELMQRIEEDEAKIATLERLAKDGYDSKRLKATLRQTEDDLGAEKTRVSELERRLALSDGEKTYTQDQLGYAESEVVRLKDVLSAQATEIGRLRTELAAKLDDRMDVDRPHSAGRASSPDREAIANQIERLLGAVERLRGERDGLLRNVSFLESEHKAAVRALESKIASLSQSNGVQTDSTVDQLRDDLEQALSQSAQFAGQMDVMRLDAHRMGLLATASLVMVQNFALHTEQLQDQVVALEAPRNDLSADLAQSHQKSVELEGRIQELQVQLEEYISSLESVTGDRDDILTRLKEQERASLMESMSGKETARHLRNDLERAENQVQQLSNALENVESERDSLNLQLTNLSDDLKKAQDELTRAEARYSDLQFNQLSSMSSHEVNASLRERIKELEGRVLRRTEQIGIHQHDIKRMETNLKLQEERLAELTAELDMMASQKDAMVEDCADAREARDNAIARLEAMEMEMEGRIEEGERTVETLVSVIIETITAAKERIMKSDEDLRSTKDELARLEDDYKRVMELLEEKEAALKASEAMGHDIQQSTLALAVSQSGLQKALAYIKDILEQKISLRQEIAAQRALIQHEQAESENLKLELSQLQEESTSSEESHATLLAELRAKIAELDETIQENEAVHREAIERMQISNDTLQATVDQTQKLLLEHDNDDRLSKLQAQYEDETAAASQRLSAAESEATDLRRSLEETKHELEASLADARTAQSDLEQQIADLTGLLQTAKDKHTADEEARNEVLAEKEALEKAVDDAKSALEEKQAAFDELQHSYQQVNEELSRLQQNQASSLSTLTEESEQVRQQLERDIADLKASLDEHREQLDYSKTEATNLSNALAAQAEQHRAETDTLNMALSSSQQRLRGTEDTLQQAQIDLETVQGEISRLHEEVSSLQQERDVLQEQSTNLEAENQRSISLHRYLENQVKDSERRIASLTDDLEQTRAQLAAADQATKTAETNLSLQSAQFKREMSELQKQLSNLQSRPDLHGAFAELEERNNEMEELLRKKCAEIEENDDRALEMLKDNKKLTSKVESLTRKVQNLQTKLTAAKAALSKPLEAPASTVVPMQSPPPVAQAPAAMTSQTQPSTRSSISPSTVPSSRPSVRHSQVSSAIQESQIPEENPAPPPPVFKARTPERPLIHPIAAEAMAAAAAAASASSSSSSIGKKRRAPDDDDLGEDKRLPAQVFTAESLPSQEHRTGDVPRARRVLNGLQSGFTPKRNQNRPAASPSPRKPLTKKFASTSVTGAPQPSTVIHDVTNSPRNAPQADQSGKEKRSWLTKIRSNHGQPVPGRTSEARSRYD